MRCHEYGAIDLSRYGMHDSFLRLESSFQICSKKFYTEQDMIDVIGYEKYVFENFCELGLEHKDTCIDLSNELGNFPSHFLAIEEDDIFLIYVRVRVRVKLIIHLMPISTDPISYHIF
ncbi:hypothetical protein ACJX0J_019454 [Zea mays]